jgi:hypothetical protein
LNGFFRADLLQAQRFLIALATWLTGYHWQLFCTLGSLLPELLCNQKILFNDFDLENFSPIFA